jgi:membrane-associated phospholipid phosphatase
MNRAIPIATHHDGGARPTMVMHVTHRGCHIFLFGIIAALSVTDLTWLPRSTVALDLPSLLRQLPAPLLMLSLSFIYSYTRPAPRIAATCLAIAEISLFALPAAIFSYLCVRLGFPLADGMLARWDGALRFDWPAYVNFVLHRPWLALVLYMLYASSVAQIALVSLVLGFTARFQELISFVAILMLTGCITILCGGLMPALSGYGHFGLDDHGIAGFDTDVLGSLNGTLHVISFDHIEGLVMFPSYHTVISVVLVIMCRHLRYLKYPVLIFNIALIASIPVFGGHYLVDILAGTVLAVLTFLVWRLVTDRRQEPAAGLASSQGAQP